MSDFVDNEAEVSEDSDHEEVGKKIRRPENTKIKVEEQSSEEEEDTDERVIAEEMKDLINDDVEEEEDNDEPGDRKRSPDELEHDLDEDDYALIEENLGRKIKWRKKFRRIRQLDDDDEENDADRNRAAKDAIANELFDQEIYKKEYVEDVVKRDHVKMEVDLSNSEESEEDNFIVDDHDQPINLRKAKKGQQLDRAFELAQEVFGFDFSLEDNKYYSENANLEEKYGERNKKKNSQDNKVSIFELYEPAELEQNYLTEHDNEICFIDLPERFQLRAVPVTPCFEKDKLQNEADWIHKELYSVPMLTLKSGATTKVPLGGFKPKQVKDNICQVLQFIRNESFEVPFIAHYRKEFYQPNLNIEDLWLIYRWDEHWCKLQEKKNNLLTLLENMLKYQESIIATSEDQILPRGMRQITKRDVEWVNKIESFEEFDDCNIHFQFYYSSYVLDMKKYIKEESRELMSEEKKKIEEDNNHFVPFKRASLSIRRHMYTVFRQFGISEFAAKFGLTPEQFGENLSEGYNRNEVVQLKLKSLKAAEEFVSKRFTTPERVLEAAIAMVAKQLACDPLTRKTMREAFYKQACVNVRPTKKGQDEIDELHPCFPIKYLKNKFMSSFNAEQFLQLTLAEKDELVTINISSKNEDAQFNDVKLFYHRDEFSDDVKLWNLHRSKAVSLALKIHLYPDLIKEITHKTVKEAHFEIIQECSQKLYPYLNIAPLSVKFDKTFKDEFSTDSGVRVLGLAFTPNNEGASFAVIIDGNGQVTDTLKLNFLMHQRIGGFGTSKETPLMKQEFTKLKKFTTKYKPHAIAVGCDTILTRDVVNEIKAMLTELSYPSIRVEYMPSDLAHVYMNSKRATAEFRSYPLKLRKAISLARRLQDPLTEFAQLCTVDNEILCLSHHLLQNAVPENQLLDALHQQFVNVVNAVGVDVSRCLVHSNRTTLVQFISGFGPRKSKFLLNFKRHEVLKLSSRRQLVQACDIGKNVFINCAGFIKINAGKLYDDSQGDIDPLDCTRIHPETYDWAKRMAADALDYGYDNETGYSQALDEIIKNPGKLYDLDLDQYAIELKKQGYGLKRDTLHHVREELIKCYHDQQPQLRSPTAEQIFEMLTGENTKAIIGKMFLVRATDFVWRELNSKEKADAQPTRDKRGQWKCCYCYQDAFIQLDEVWKHIDSNICQGVMLGVKVRLDNQLTGTIFNRNLSDQAEESLSRVKIGMPFHCRVKRVKPKQFWVELTISNPDLEDQGDRYKPPKDKKYDFEAENRDKSMNELAKRKACMKAYHKRVIHHDSFKNIDFVAAEKILRESEQGKFIIRPSSKSKEWLTLSWKVYNEIHQHVIIREECKPNAFTLGQKLIIDKEEFEDLDEIVSRYVSPMVRYSREILSFKYFFDLKNKHSIEKYLAQKKKNNPTNIPYCFTASKEIPGKFILSSQPNNKMIHEFVSLTHQGFKYRMNFFKSRETLLKWFKANFNNSATVKGPCPFSRAEPISSKAIQQAAAAMSDDVFNTLTVLTSSKSRNFFQPQSLMFSNQSAHKASQLEKQPP